jgi:hypothetical protein
VILIASALDDRRFGHVSHQLPGSHRISRPTAQAFRSSSDSRSCHRELQSDAAPDPIKRFLAEAPDWLEVRPSPEIDPVLGQLDSGERDVIALALLIGADSVLLDERKGVAPPENADSGCQGLLV